MRPAGFPGGAMGDSDGRLAFRVRPHDPGFVIVIRSDICFAGILRDD